jgi:DnaJ-class molecular chaperone
MNELRPLPDGYYEECRFCEGEGMRLDVNDCLVICARCSGAGYVEHDCENEEGPGES